MHITESKIRNIGNNVKTTHKQIGTEKTCETDIKKFKQSPSKNKGVFHGVR